MDDKKTPGTTPHRENGQGEHHGVPHSPEEFDVMNPAKLKQPPSDDVPAKD